MILPQTLSSLNPKIGLDPNKLIETSYLKHTDDHELADRIKLLCVMLVVRSYRDWATIKYQFNYNNLLKKNLQH